MDEEFAPDKLLTRIPGPSPEPPKRRLWILPVVLAVIAGLAWGVITLNGGWAVMAVNFQASNPFASSTVNHLSAKQTAIKFTSLVVYGANRSEKEFMGDAEQAIQMGLVYPGAVSSVTSGIIPYNGAVCEWIPGVGPRVVVGGPPASIPAPVGPALQFIVGLDRNCLQAPGDPKALGIEWAIAYIDEVHTKAGWQVFAWKPVPQAIGNQFVQNYKAGVYNQ